MSMSCSTNSTVRPSSRSDFTWPSSDCLSAGFTPAIGSSSITSSGSAISARAISSSLRWPPDSEPAKSSRFLISRNRSSSASARSVLAVSWLRHSGANIAAAGSRRVWPVAPTRMFSMTVSLESTLVSWKVRTMPSRATR